jgi:hypothetical protein
MIPEQPVAMSEVDEVEGTLVAMNDNGGETKVKEKGIFEIIKRMGLECQIWEAVFEIDQLRLP